MPGYAYQFISHLKRELYCGLCELPMRDPVQLSTCNHRFCDLCLHEYLNKGVFQCPRDYMALDYAKIYPDNASNAEIMSSSVRCPNYKGGCQWVDRFNALQSHLKSCGYDSVPCPNDCSMQLSRLTLEDHMKFTCPRRLVRCEFCCQDFSGREMDENHEGNCPKETVWCENKCGARVQRRYLSNHMRNECHRRTIQCSFCGKEFVFETLQNHHHQCQRYLVSCPNRCENGKIPRDELEQHLSDSCPLAVISCSFKYAGCNHSCTRSELKIHLDNSCCNHLSLLNTVVRNQDVQLTRLREQLDVMTRNTTGVYIWRIAGMSTKITNGKAKPNYEIRSDSFYTGRCGYKLSASIFPAGNGPGQGTHMSLYIRMMPGEYDNILNWPFSLPVSFKLYDQNRDIDKRQHIVESFVPNPSWKHFEQPKKDIESLGFGYPKFIALDSLLKESYIHDDCIFIRVKVDLSSFSNP